MRDPRFIRQYVLYLDSDCNQYVVYCVLEADDFLEENDIGGEVKPLLIINNGRDCFEERSRPRTSITLYTGPESFSYLFQNGRVKLRRGALAWRRIFLSRMSSYLWGYTGGTLRSFKKLKEKKLRLFALSNNSVHHSDSD